MPESVLPALAHYAADVDQIYLEENSGALAEVARRYRGLCWPQARQRDLLRTLFLGDDDARAAYARFEPNLELDALDGASRALLPLLGRRLQELAIRDQRLARLLGLRHYHWCRNSLLIREAAEVRIRLHDAGIRCVVLKGLAVLESYADLGLRPMHDVDFLVAPGDFARAERVLQARGFRYKPPEQPHARAFVRDAYEIDLHDHALLEDPREAPDRSLLASAEPVRWGEFALDRPAPALTLAHLLVHGARFSTCRPLHWAADAMHLLRAGGVDWKRFADHVIERELTVQAFETLRYLQEDLGVELPNGLLDEFESRSTVWHWAEYACHADHPRRVGSAHRTAVRLCHRSRTGRAPHRPD